MRTRLVPALAIAFYLAMAVAVTYPGYVPFNRIRPFVLGLPFSLFWQVLWISSAVFVLAGVYLWESRRRGAGRADKETPPRSDPEGA